MTTIYLAFSPFASGSDAMAEWYNQHDRPGLLVSFYYLDKYDKSLRNKIPRPAKTVLDSGAYSAWSCGGTIDIDALTEEAKSDYWDEVVALDVVGDPDTSASNTYKMLANGLSCDRLMPVFHYGEPWDLLAQYCKDFRKVGLSCLFGEKMSDSYRWIDQCFARAWPHRFHSFGWACKKLLNLHPFDSADMSSWCNPRRFGRVKNFRDLRIKRGFDTDLTIECGHYARMESFLQSKWKRSFAQLTEGVEK